MNCSKCQISQTSKINCLMGKGNINAPIVIIGEGPGYEEELYSDVFIGQSGKYLNEILSKGKIKKDDCYITNVIKCRATKNGENRPPTDEEIENCKEFLNSELNALQNKKIIILLGNIALKAITGKTGITRYRGCWLDSEKYNCKLFATFHPSAVLRDWSKNNIVLADIKKIKDFLDGKNMQSIENYIYVDDIELFDEVTQRLNEVSEFAIDLETTGFNFQKDKIICINLSWKEGTGVVIPLLKSKKVPPKPKRGEMIPPLIFTYDDIFWGEKQKYILNKLKEVMNNNAKKIGWNIRFDNQFLIFNNMSLNNIYFDGMLAAYLLDENMRGMYDLKTQSTIHTDKGGYEKVLEEFFEMNKHIKNEFIYLSKDILLKYGAGDADCTFRLYKIFKKLLEEDNLIKTYFDLIMPMDRMLEHVEINGMQIDVDYLKNLKNELKKELSIKMNEIKNEIGDININSPLQLRKVLFDVLHLPIVKYTNNIKVKTPSTDEEVLNILANQHHIPKKIVEYRKITKLLGTYVEGIEKFLDENDRVHPSFLIHGTVSGRLACRDPNLQNIPRDDKRIKKMFIAKEGNVLIESDFAQLEFRLWNLYAQDPKLMMDLKSDLDIHKLIASKVFHIPIENITKGQRQQAKNVVFGLLYGRGAKSVAEEFGFSIQDAQRITKMFFTSYPQAKQWIENNINNARINGKVKSFFGRCRRLLDINSSDEFLRSEAERQATNTPIQSAASDLNCLTGINILERFKKENIDGKLVLLVHDSLMFEVPEEFYQRCCLIIKEVAENVNRYEINVPIKVELKIGKRWSELEIFEI